MAYCEKKTAEPVIPAAAYVLTLTEDEARRVLAACRSRIDLAPVAAALAAVIGS